MLRASEVVLVAEVVSPSSVRTDHVVKRGEYAGAGIPHYWIVDLDDPVSLIACHLAGDFGYRDGGAVTGVVTVTAPFAVEIDLGPLVQWSRPWVLRGYSVRRSVAVRVVEVAAGG